MGVLTFFKKLIEVSDEINEDNFDVVKNQITDFLKAIKKDKEEIRIFVAGSINLGHQSTSIIMMDRLIDLDFTRIRIIYEKRKKPEDVDPLETATKLVRLIYGVKNEDIENGKFTFSQPEKNKEITIFFSKFEEFSAEIGGNWVTLGIAGGFDETKNITGQLFVKCLLVLQPYRYKKFEAKNIIYLNQKMNLQPKNDGIELTSDFVEKAFYIKDPAKPSTYLEKELEGREEWQRKMLNIVLTKLESQEIEMCPVYFSEGRTESTPPTILFNLLTGLLAYKKKSDNQKPIIIFVIADLRPYIYLAMEDILKGIKEFWSKPSNEDLQKYNENKNGHTKVEIAKNTGLTLEIVNNIERWKFAEFMSKEVYEYINRKGYFWEFKKTVFISYEENEKDNKTFLELIEKEANDEKIFIVDLKRVPKPVFNYLYYNNTLPGMFEGEATASLILNIGNPYFNINSLENASNNDDLILVPEQPNAPDMASEFQPYEWNKLGKTKPDEMIGQFILDAYTAETPVKQYFDNLRGLFHSENDKLMQGLYRALLNIKEAKHLD